MSDGEEEVVAVIEEEEVTDMETAIKKVLRTSLAHGSVTRGLHETAKAIEAGNAQVVFLSESCDEGNYKKLVTALCAEKGVPMVSVPTGKELGERAGLCKIDKEGLPRKVVSASCCAVVDYGEETQAVGFFKSKIGG
eukprot:NODE_18895_length_869_cov_8.319407.p2 GENE.NODE_18895_length_869_cov_8.319407~~NODE_18895_length_869_cov_8.319407.p2  ORF type:complete len:137 (-),score=42.96 NODE_18895_length_869_cov_8.319407:255-665(-)